MSDLEFDTALVSAAFRIAADQGWRRVNVAAASRAAGLPVAEARARFVNRASILLRFGRLADQAALLDAPSEGPVRDRLFDLLMRRFDALQAHRDGVKAVLRALPSDPPTALLLSCATRTSMRWMLQAAGVTATGPRGALQVRGLVLVWLWGVRTWERDESEDLSATMATVDTALGRAERAASWLCGGSRSAPPPVTPGAGELDPSDPPPAGDPPSSPDPLG
jgi:ubiquinone biosynthesis protein COQ9